MKDEGGRGMQRQGSQAFNLPSVLKMPGEEAYFKTVLLLRPNLLK